MHKTFLSTALAAACVACSGGEKPAEAPAEAPAAPAEAKGAETAEAKAAPFDAKTAFTTVCASCHGANGQGDGPAAAGLNPKPAAFGDPEFWKTRDKAHIQKVIKEGGAAVGKSPLMVAYGAQYNDEQISQLADVVLSFKPADGAAEKPKAE